MFRSAIVRSLLGVAAFACAPDETMNPATGGAPHHEGGALTDAGRPALGGTSSAAGGTSGAPVGGFSPSVAGAATSGNGGVAGAATPSASGGALAGEGGGTPRGGSTGSAGDAPIGGTVVTNFVPKAVKDLPSIKELPDPLTMIDGTKVTTPEQWRVRRQEMIQILEEYEYGHMPPPPGDVKASITTEARRVTPRDGLEAEYRKLRLSFGPEQKLGFDLGIFTPTGAGADEKYPVLVYLTFNANENSLSDASAALARGYAVATVPYSQLGADSASWKSSAFFPSYPDYDWRDISAWAWGLSRAVDYLVTDPALDPSKILATGVSRLAQAVLLAGAFDERIALSAPVAGGMAFRFSGKEMGGGLGQGITEVVDQNTYWFGPRFEEFRNQTPRLPCDQHWLPALTAPRLFILSNSLSDQYGRAYAAVQTYLGAKPVYEFLGAAESLGIHFRPGGHGMTAENWSAILDFSDQYLLKKAGTRKFDVIPPKDQLP